MDARLEQFRAEARQVGERRAGRKFPKRLIASGGVYARERRSEGASWNDVAAELGVSLATVRRWRVESPAAGAAFKPVHVVDAPRREGFTVTIGALRIEGLALEALVALAKAMS